MEREREWEKNKRNGDRERQLERDTHSEKLRVKEIEIEKYILCDFKRGKIHFPIH